MSNSTAEVRDKPIRVQLMDRVALSQSNLFLKDIAKISVKENVALQDKLEKLSIGKAPRVGQKLRITQERIKYLVNRQFGHFMADMQWQGSKTIEISSLGRVYDYRNLQDVAHKLLFSFLSARFNKYEITGNEDIRNVMVPMGKIKILPRLQKQEVNRKMVVWADILVDERHYQSVPVWFDVKVWSKVLVLTKDKNARSILQKEDLSLQDKDISNINAMPPKLEALVNTRLLHTLKKGAIVLPKHVELLPAVVKGQSVRVYAGHGEVRLQTQGIALEDGEIGKLVKIENPKSREIYQAYVIRVNEVATEKRYVHD